MRDPLHDTESPRSRRSLFKWLGQVAAGATVAGIGLSALNTQAAHAASPDSACVGCTLIACYAGGGCGGDYPFEVQCRSYSGQPPCTSQYVYGCASDCQNATCYGSIGAPLCP